jgi:hypothetical protein
LPIGTQLYWSGTGSAYLPTAYNVPRRFQLRDLILLGHCTYGRTTPLTKLMCSSSNAPLQEPCTSSSLLWTNFFWPSNVLSAAGACTTQSTLITPQPFTQLTENYKNFAYSSRMPRPHDTSPIMASTEVSLLHGRLGREDGGNEWLALQNGAYEMFWDIGK